MTVSYSARRFSRHLLGSAAAGAILFTGTAAHAAEAEVDADQSATIIVTGQRLSTESAIAAKKDALNVIEEVSADDLGKLPDANVADAIARVPGISVIVNQDTGEGEYVAIRGLSGTYNAVSINGVRVAQTDPGSRDVSLTVLPPNGLAAIRVSKTRTPDMDGDAIAGAIDFRTPTAFDFSKPTILRAYASAGLNGRAHSAGEDAESYQGQLDFGKKFGDGWGFFVTGYYGVSHGNGQETENDGEWEPHKWRKDSEEAISEANMHLPGIDLDYRRLEQTRYGGNFSLDYKGDALELYVRGQIARQEQRGTNDYTDYRNRPTARLVQTNVEDTSLLQPSQMVDGQIIRNGSTYKTYGYTTAQIVDQDGDGVISDLDRATRGYWSLAGRSGVWNPEAFQFARSMNTINLNQTLGTVEAGGRWQSDKMTLVFSGSYSGGSRENPENYSVGYNCDKCTFPLNATGLDWVSNDPRFPHASMPAFAEFVERDPSLLPFDGASHSRDKQSDDRFAIKADLTYEVGGVLDYVQAGVKWLRSKRKYDYTPLYDGDFSGTSLDGKTLATSGLIDKDVTSMLSGEYYYGAVFNPAAVIAAIDAAAKVNGSGVDEEDLLRDDKSGRETLWAGYALAKFGDERASLVAGARMEHREVHNEFWSDDGDNSGFDSTDSNSTQFLPSLTATFRPTNSLVVRGALWTGYSPPEYGYISSGQSVTRDSATNEIIAISRGNPDLKPAKSYNADLSMEYYPDASSLVSVAGFYKRIDNFIFTNGSQVNADTQNGTIEISQPKNGEKAEVYGVEFNLIRSFQGLPAPFDGFGFSGNLTLQHSSAETGLDYRKGRPTSLINTPSVLYNAALTYQKYGFEAKISYNYRGKFIESLRDNAVDKWVQHNRSVDLHTRYNVNDRLAFDFDVGNLLDDWKYYTTKGDNPSYQKDYMEPGRTYTFRLTYVY
ncbi:MULTISPECIES: TonB-dependent receptor [unclassified Sphingobium]|uniref:TonB-dependent receptor n=1 Tax=unclassified Sphingobium TaxID=2611147 RepID=UPI002224C7A6|nr:MULTISPECIES: TonB-dependent receptor [unclassified Sphingobium]MCW2410727.1 TonB-dependent receptor [Sphingobium sp. B8D3D]MCW2416983.1 TonB-dependent receptor [Sphingobium sp. B8D3A]